MKVVGINDLFKPFLVKQNGTGLIVVMVENISI